ncbi:uncharacterized protein LOC131877965 [Tigriopus californicus]|uniref:uncharacterized protein LOC131877965 n=1 Tax=Tigriopus californicus TaxID=6832 RepID=UPI0027DA24A9|nr:uncharacterized protein LOC131877965 [Tigriopus californicus]
MMIGWSQFSEFSHCIEASKNYQNTDHISEINESSIQDCSDACQSNAECDHGVYLSNLRQCILKDKKGTSVPTTNNHLFTIPKLCVPGCSMDGTDYSGHNIMSFDTHDAFECQELCQANPDCVGVVWIRPYHSFRPRGCYLKRLMNVANQKSLAGTISLPKYCLNSHKAQGSFFVFEDSAYQFIGEKMSFSQARQTCRDRQGSLASMETKEEYLFIYSAILQLNVFNSTTFSGNYHIGLTKHIDG